MIRMNLQDGPFNLIKSGKKKIEMRLNDEKRSTLKVGDIIVFSNPCKEELVVRVTNLKKFKDFDELYAFYDKRMLGYLLEEEARPDDMSIYYKKEDIIKYGVLAIEIE